MLKRYASLTFVFLAVLCLTGCVWSIGSGREMLAVGLGCVALLTFVAAWLIVLPSAMEHP
jgi:hypothetical protein